MISGSPSQFVVVEHRGSPGLLPGIFGCVFGLLGIFSIGIVFVPLAALCAIIGIVRVLMHFNLTGLGVSALAAALTFFGFLCSPSLLILAGGLLTSSLFAIGTSPSNLPKPTLPNSPTSQTNRTLAPVNARDEAMAASLDCKNKRLTGELKGHVASVECSNPRILVAYENSGYRYMDLIRLFIAKRRALAEQVDKGLITEAQDEFQLGQFMGWIADEERRRNSGQK